MRDETFNGDDKLHEECGVFGVYTSRTDTNVAPLVYYGLFSLQHRGQESAGIAVAHDGTIECRKGMGLVGEVFAPATLAQLSGNLAIGHVRYSTAGSSTIENAQPFVSRFKLGSIAVAHNGNLTNASVVRELLEDAGVGFVSSSDSEVIINLIAKNYKKGLEKALTDTIQFIKGSYALVVMTDTSLVGARDPHGIRPLCLGKINDGWVLASESCAIDAVGGEFVRDIDPGEIVVIDQNGVLSFRFGERTRKAVCAFEYIYFARPDSILQGQSVYRARCELGAQLAREHPAEADMVMGIPDSATTAAIGYAHEAGIPFGEGLIKNRYIGRTFIQPDDRLRQAGVALKFNPLPDNLAGKRVVVVDDSIVRGNTSGPIMAMLRRAGAREIHMRISSPPIRHTCMMGVDMATREELIAARLSLDEIRNQLGVDSLGYLSLEGLLRGVGRPAEHFCLACFSGHYAVGHPCDEGREVFDGVIAL